MDPRTPAAVALAILLVAAGCSLGPQTTSSPTSDETPADAPPSTATPAPTRNWSVSQTGATDAPADGRAARVSDPDDLPRLYRQHRAATSDATFALDATYRIVRDGNRTAWLTVDSQRGENATLDHARWWYPGRDYAVNETVTRVRTAETYRTHARGPTLFYRHHTSAGRTLRQESGTLQGVPASEALVTTPWRYRELVVRLATAGDYDDGERVTVDGERFTRYRASEVDRRASDALGLADEWDDLSAVAGSPVDADYPTGYEGTVLADDEGRIRRVNLTLSRPRQNDSYRTVPTTVRVDARLSAVNATRVADEPPRWVERTPRLWVRPLDESGVALSVEHRGGPTVDVGGSLRTRTEGSVTAFPLLVRQPVEPGETLYAYLYPDDDGNEMEAGTAVGERPEGPFVRGRLSAVSFYSSEEGTRDGLDHEHLVGVNATAS